MKLALSDLDFAGKRVLVRVDFNVPLNDHGQVADDTRVRAALPTLRTLLDAGATPVLMSHLGRPKGEPDPAYSLQAVGAHLDELLMGIRVIFCTSTVGAEAEACVAGARDGSIVLLENTRFLAGEKKNDSALAAQLAKLGDEYVNDAFGSAHRAHASTTGVAEAMEAKGGHAAMGLLLAKEVEFLSEALAEPGRPFVGIIGGAKVSDKIGVIEALVEKVDTLLIGGAMAYTFLRAQGHTTGTSLVEEDWVERAKALLDAHGDTLLIPTDHVIADGFSNDAAHETVMGNIPDGWMGLDIGPKTVQRYEGVLAEAKTVIWNGPMGVFEMSNYAAGTLAVAKALAQATNRRGALTVVGGGDSVAAISQANLDDDVSHVSTGGGAMLELLEGKTLPGIAALTEKV
ncbi:MAG: phosphoglycerate kinase [Bacteroidota bacterium]